MGLCVRLGTGEAEQQRHGKGGPTDVRLGDHERTFACSRRLLCRENLPSRGRFPPVSAASRENYFRPVSAFAAGISRLPDRRVARVAGHFPDAADAAVATTPRGCRFGAVPPHLGDIMRAINVQELSEVEARAFLARNHTGRIAFSQHDRVDIQPISYAYDNGWILGRTSIGTKLSTLAHNPWCAFEVDEVSGPLDWTSVVARGAFHLLDPEWGSADVYTRALASVVSMQAGAFSAADPAPHRNVLFGIYVNEITGRRARHADDMVACRTPIRTRPAPGLAHDRA